LGPGLIALGVVALLVLVPGLWVLKSWATVRSDLEADGYASPKVTFKGPFTFAFTAMKGASSCSGTVTRFPGSSSREEMCYEPTPIVPPAPVLTNRQEVEKSLEKNYAKFAFTKCTCPEIADADTKTSCTLAGDNGASVTAQVERTKVDTDGTWGEWSTTLDAPVGKGEDLSADLTKSVGDTAKAKHPSGVDVDCGAGPVVFSGGKATCTFTTRDKKPMHGNVELTSKPGGGYKWTAKL
jgi:hypothetical protein